MPPRRQPDTASEENDNTRMQTDTTQQISREDLIRALIAREERDNMRTRIPAETYRIISKMPKLNKTNWHSWNNVFLQLLRDVEGAHDVLKGEATNADHKLDAELYRAMYSSFELEGVKTIAHIVGTMNKRGLSSATEMYRGLQEELTKNDKVAISTLFRRANELRLHGNDVTKLISEIDELWAESEELNRPLSEDYKIGTLTKEVERHWRYSTTINNMRDAGTLVDYARIVENLTSAQAQMELTTANRPLRVAAVSEDTSHLPTGIYEGHWKGRRELNNQSETLNRPVRVAAVSEDTSQFSTGVHEGYWKGRRDPNNPSAAPKCFICQQEGHIARRCPSRGFAGQGARKEQTSESQ